MLKPKTMRPLASAPYTRYLSAASEERRSFFCQPASR
jgi:hypothetical protein